MESYLPFLATTGNITPFIGLLGTVLGIIDSFREIGQQGTASIGAVAPGVAEALVATAMGLFTAIPAVVAYNVLQKRIGEVEADSLAMVRTITAHLKANPDAFIGDLEEERALEAEAEAEQAPAALRSEETMRSEPAPDGAAA